MLHVTLLGEQAISDESGVRTRSPRTVALVAYLAAHAEAPQTRQRIAGLFWPESTGAQALTNLRRELHHLRKVLGAEPSLTVTSRDLCWRDTETCRVDVRVFESAVSATLAAEAAGDDRAVIGHAARAVAQYRGDLLPGMYDEWILDARSRLERTCARMCDLLAAARARTGDLTGAVEAARLRIRLQPLEEVGYRALMRLQAELGDGGGAISTYHHCASVLERELGVVPDPATRREFQRLMARAAPESAPAAGTGPPRAAVPVAGRSGRAGARLVGRSGELAWLRGLWTAAEAGRPVLAVVRGGAGVGKTRLVAEVADAARRRGAVVAGSQCFASPGRLALAPVADWLRTPVIRSATKTLAAPWRAEVERLVPVAAAGRPPEPRAAGRRAMADAWRRHRFFEGLARALIAVGRPMLLVLDNMHWCDQETLAFLTFYLRLHPGTPVMVAGTLRDDHLVEDPELAEWTDAMRTAGLLTELSLHPLEVADTARLAGAVAGRRVGADEAALLQATTGGFPLYVIEAVRGGVRPADPGAAGDGAATVRPAATGAADGGAREPVHEPAASRERASFSGADLTGVLRNRLEQASAAAREVAGLAAAVGTDFTLDLLAEASDLDTGVVAEAVDELWRRRIVREFGDGYDFSHDLLRETAYALVSPPKRWLLHRRVAQALELLHADDTDAVAGRLAAQYARGGRPGRAVTYYRRAADVAAAVFAHAEAVRLHKEALSILPSLPEGRERDARELGILEAMAAPLNARYGYSSPELQHTLERAVALAESLGRAESVLTGLVGLWTSRFVQGRIRDGYRTAVRALDLAADGERGAAAHFAAGGSALSLGRPAEALCHLERAAALSSGAVSLSVGTRPDVHARAWAAHAHWLLGDDDAAQACCADAIALARSIAHPYSQAVALAYGAITHQIRGDAPGVREAAGELRALCERYDFAYYREWGLILDGWARAGGAGIDLVRRGVGALRAQGAFARMPYWLALLADLAGRDGRADSARATLDAALAAAHAHDDVWWLPEVSRMRAAYDHDAAAVARLRAAAGMAAAHGSVALLRRCERDLAERGDRGNPAGPGDRSEEGPQAKER